MDNSCGATVGVDPDAIYIGQAGPFSYTFEFGTSVQEVTLVINASDHISEGQNESFTFSSNIGNLSLDQECGCYDINDLTAGCDAICSDAGGKLIITSDIPFDELTVEGPGLANGSLMGICSIEEPQGCNIILAVLDTICDDNGTPTDPSDDLFYFEVEVSGSGNSMGWIVDDIHNSSGLYNDPTVLGPYEIANGDLDLLFEDMDIDSCEFSLQIEAPPSCSDSCVVAIEILEYFCDDNATPVDSTDDLYYVELVVVNVNGSMTWQANDPNNSTGAYGDTVLLGPYDISGGIFNVVFSDELDVSCSENLDFVPPPACSDSCIINLDYSLITCFDNGTPATAADDVFFIEFRLNSQNTYDSWISDDSLATGGLYDLEINAGPYRISEGDITINFQDAENSECPIVVSFEAPEECSECVFDAVFSHINESCQDSEDGRILIDEIIGGNPPFELVVNGESYGQVLELNDLADGEYSVQLIDSLDCILEETIEILPGPLVGIEINPVDIIFEGDSVPLSLNISNAVAAEIDSIVWMPSEYFSCTNCLNPYFTANETQEISVWISTVAGCQAEANSIINTKIPEVYVPNAFSPNGDGLNDEFRVFAAPNRVKEINMSVFGRWGNLVFQGAGDLEKIRWDGSHKGELKSSNVFVYSIDVELVSGRKLNITGDITLLR